MSIKRNRFGSDEAAMEPRVMLSGAVPGAEAPAQEQAAESTGEEAQQDEAAPQDEEQGESEEDGQEVAQDDESQQEAGEYGDYDYDDDEDDEVEEVDEVEDVEEEEEEEVAPVDPEQQGVVADEEGQTVNNPAGETISSDQTAVEVVADDVTINNAGEIAGAVNGVDFDENTEEGTLNNNGVVSSDSRAVQIDGDEVTINNNGSIVGTGDQRNGTVYSNRTADEFTINNNGLIDAGEGNLGAGVSTELVEEGTEFDLNNNGTIQGRGNAPAGAATAGDGVRLERTRVGGQLDGTTVGLFEGTINNNGTIDSEGANGTVAGVRVVNGVSFQGELNNNGTISGVQNGVYFGNPTPAGGGDHTGGVVNNNGTITSDSRAFNLDGIGLEVNNNGSIIGTDDQRNGTFYADGTADDFTVNNSGLIDAGKGNEGSGFGAEIGGAADGANTFTLDNSGSIAGRGNAAAGTNAAGDGVRIGNPGNSGIAEATINNSGSITSEGANGTVGGVRFVDGVGLDGELNNSGTISGVQNGVYFGNADHSEGVVNNSGTISSDSRAFNLDGIGLEVNNSGQIIGTDDQRNGTFYADGTADDFTVNNSGLIDAGKGNEGSGFGAEIGGAADGANTFSLDNSGLIQGRGNAAAGTNAAGDGVRIGNPGNSGVAEGTITNSGAIRSEGANGTVGGVRVVDGVSFVGTLDNTGEISGVQNGVYFGNADHTGGVVNNEGLISSDSRAFNLDGIGLEVNNSGSILGTDDQRNGTFYADGTADDFTVNNSGLIDAGKGNEGSGFGAEIGGAADGANTFSLDNSGTIQGRGNAAAGTNAAGDGVRIGNPGNSGVTDATITNSGLIASEGANGTVGGVRVVDGVSFTGELDNSGTITGVQNGVYFGNADHTGGVVNNSGLISSDSRAFNLDGIGLEVNNSGSILGTDSQRNGTFYADGTADDFTVNNSGLIDAGKGNEGSGFGAEIGGAADGANTFTLDNSGTIAGRGNAAAGTNAAGDGVRIGNPGNSGIAEATIVNTGSITSEGANGTVGGIRFVDGVGLDGTLDNSGSISGVQNGVYFGDADHTGGVVNNSGLISSDSRAFNLDGIGLEVNNSGTILGTDSQRNGTFYADGTADDFVVNNSGLIDAGKGNEGSGFGAEIGSAADGANTFTLDNSGTIQGRGNAAAGVNAAGDGVRIGNVGNIGVAEVTLNNSGTIDSEGANGTVAGVRFVNGISFAGEINNTGTISGVQNGLYFGNAVNGEGADHSDGVVNNLKGGVISSDSRAVNIDGDGLTLNNSGDILATGRQRNGTVYADATADNFTIDNSGRIDARGGAGSGVSIQVGSEVGDVQTASITNSGEIFAAGELDADAGVRLFNSVDGQTTFKGDIVNSGLISSENDNAVLVEEGVKFNGDFINSGRVDGGIDLATGDVVLTSKSSVTLDIGGVYDVEQIDVDNGDVQFGGELVVNFNDGFLPEAGQTFDLIDFNSQSGSFSSVRSDQVEFDLSNLAIDGTVTVIGPVAQAGDEIVAAPKPTNRVERFLQRQQKREARFAQRVQQKANRFRQRVQKRQASRSERFERLSSRLSSRLARRGLRSLFGK